MADLAATLARLYALADLAPVRADALAAFAELKRLLNCGQARAARRTPAGWVAEAWVKQGILLGFRLGALAEHPSPPPFSFFDKDTLPTRRFALTDQVRLVPGGTTVRDGAYLAPGVICMPPAFVNIGAYVDSGTMIDSHALVGSCAQVGARVHLSAAAQIGGVLEPINAAPVVIEDEVLVGGNCGVYEGTQVGAGAVLAAGVVLTRSTPLYDLPRGLIHHASPDQPLRVPEGAVVVPGARAVTRGSGPAWGLSLSTPVIVKYRDGKTAAAVELEDWLR
ncbi:MAG TPA: 2,3,4,5-tetrahydropyridine-2,6-dicarboxylate N-succinyltransferase [Terriglobales bacterium]|nr:2,3,4,5-tetrahydropyridine-2,6-dicarboxylate N-succinyltransferase [Terriglobales bacterium]